MDTSDSVNDKNIDALVLSKTEQYKFIDEELEGYQLTVFPC